MMSVWHFIIPFFYGENKFVLAKGGAPVRRKLSYLRQTLASIDRLPVRSRITLFVCNEVSEQRARGVHPLVRRLDCAPVHLPLETVKAFQSQYRAQEPGDDIVVFTEDDQILTMADSVKDDIQDTTERVVFSPHRWARQFLYFRRKRRPVYYLNGRRGLLDNTDTAPDGPELRFNHRYVVQSNRHAAYAACWCMRCSQFRTLDLDSVPMDEVQLESASYIVFESGIPVVKLRIDENQSPSLFIVDHLSGYDYNKRLIK